MSFVLAVRLAQFVKKRLEPRDGSLVTFHLAGPAACFGVVGELAFEAEAFANSWRVLGCGDEFSACEV